MKRITNKSDPARGKRVVVVGAGGNIGSHLIPHLGRLPQITSVVLIDKDLYENGNLRTQDIAASDLGKAKASVQERRLRVINPALVVEAVNDSIERVPVGRLRSDLILACLDSRIARQRVNQYAWHLGVPFIDAGVEATNLLARINVYIPDKNNPCLECAWDDRDYEALEQNYSCTTSGAKVARTNAPSGLGALAASLQAIECQKILDANWSGVATSRQVLVDAGSHKHYVTSFRRNPDCRLSDHDVWNISKRDWDKAMDLETLLRLPQGASHSDIQSLSLQVEGARFVSRLICINCGHSRSILRLESSLDQRHLMCRRCHDQMIVPGFDLIERLTAKSQKRKDLKRSIKSIGFRIKDVITIRGATGEHHFELTN